MTQKAVSRIFKEKKKNYKKKNNSKISTTYSLSNKNRAIHIPPAFFYLYIYIYIYIKCLAHHTHTHTPHSKCKQASKEVKAQFVN
jgi:hypothetical protein